jgi:hypothetical protein
VRSRPIQEGLRWVKIISTFFRSRIEMPGSNSMPDIGGMRPIGFGRKNWLFPGAYAKGRDLTAVERRGLKHRLHYTDGPPQRGRLTSVSNRGGEIWARVSQSLRRNRCFFYSLFNGDVVMKTAHIVHKSSKIPRQYQTPIRAHARFDNS